MPRCLLAIAFFAAATAPALGHPGHDHSQDVVHWAARPSQLPSQPLLPPWISVLVTVITVALTFAAAGHVSRRRLMIPGIALAAAIFFANFGCGGRGPKAASGPPQPKHDAAVIAKLFALFQKDGVTFRAADNDFFVESNAFPSHPMMTGITAWQQQVPLPQPYVGKNAWRIPLTPVVAETPISGKTSLHRGAIALAVNGVPIFNALNNRGEDAYLAGELDEYGGHCGRGDDYHYHIAPVHLEKIVGKGKPIAFALDGFPIHGYADAEGKEPDDLDELNGRFEKDGRYRYYATRKYPYINGGMRGMVKVRGDQIDPQPKDSPARPAGEPLTGARITAFQRDDEHKTYTLKYELRGKTHTIRYSLNADHTVTFIYTDAGGSVRTETHRRR